MVLVGHFLQRHLGAQQLLVLHFQFDLVDLQFVEQGANVDRGHVFEGRALLTAQTPFGLLAQARRLGQSRVHRGLLLHCVTPSYRPAVAIR